MAASTQALIDAFAAGSPLLPLPSPPLPLPSPPPTSPTYDQEPLGHRAAMIRMRDDILEKDMPPRRRFVLTAPLPGCDVAESSAAAAKAPRHIMPVTRQGTNDAMTPESIQAIIDREIQRNSTHTQDDASQNSGGGLRRPV
ncbi:hypothetical protein Tco_1423804 [Tanacetum coccineum]